MACAKIVYATYPAVYSSPKRNDTSSERKAIPASAFVKPLSLLFFFCHLHAKLRVSWHCHQLYLPNMR